MTLSNISHSNRFQSLSSLPISDSSAPGNTVAQPSPRLNASAQETGDSGMLRLYASGIRQAAQAGSGSEAAVAVAQGSRFGDWWQHFYKLTHSPIFLEWAASKNIDTSQPIEFSHHSGSLTVTVKGQRTTMDGKAQGPVGRDVLQPLMVAARALSAAPSIVAPTDPLHAPLIAVARFHGEVLLPGNKEETLTRATELEHNQAFDVLGADTYVDLKAQSLEILEQEKGKLGDDVNKFRLMQQLQDYQASPRISLESFLAHTRVPTHPDSAYTQDTQHADASLDDLLSHGGWHVPKNTEQVDNLIRALAAPALPAPQDGDFGGALTWPVPMSLADQGSLFAIIADNKPALPGLDAAAALGTVDVLGALIKQVPRWVLNQGSNDETIEWILSSDVGKALGQALKQRMGEVAENCSPREMLLTALGVTLDSKGLDAPKENHIAGFDLAAPEFFGQPLSMIRENLIKHLVSSGITTREAASVAATLLLSRAAPELLGDLPVDIKYGSFAWLAYKAAVARIEATSLGAKRALTFNDVVAFDAIDPVTDDEQEIQAQSAVSGIIQWGRASGTLPLRGEYSAAQVTDTQRAISLQQQRMLNAVNALGASVPTQRSVALAILRARYGDNVPFEEKSISSQRTQTDSHRLTPSISHDPVGRYSMLDLYLSGKAALDVGWSSPNYLIDRELWTLETLPDPVQKHEEAFKKYADDLSEAWAAVTENLIASQPPEDRNKLLYDDISVFQRGISRRTMVSTYTTSTYITDFLPSDQDKALIIKTVRDNLATYYELDPQRNTLRRRDDWRDSFKEGLQGPEVKTSRDLNTYFSAPAIKRLLPSSENVDKEKGVPDRQGVPASFSNPRSSYLGQLLSTQVIKSYHLADVKASTREVTTFDKEEEANVLMRNLVLGLIPGGSALWNLAHGKYEEAVADVIFDVVMSAVTAGIGKGAGAAKGLRTAQKPFGSALLRGFGKLSSVGAEESVSILKGLYRRVRPRGAGKINQSGVRLNPRQARHIDNRTDLFEGTAKMADAPGYYSTIARFDAGKGRWYAYNPATDKPFGKPLTDFKPTTTTHLDTRFDNLSRKAENGPAAAAFQEGYTNGDPNSIPGYWSGMTSAQVKKLAVTSKQLTPRQIGILVRQQERLAVQHGLKGANIFNNVVRKAGGSVTPMPQVFYLSQTQALSKGQCAALSHLMAEASKRGKARTLIDNFYTAAANPKRQSSKNFIQTLTDYQKKVETPSGFHGRPGGDVPSLPYTSITDNLGSSPASRTLMIGDEAHAMTAGVIVDGNTRSYFFFDPNYGVASFPSIESMRAGMKDIFTNKQFARPYKTTGLSGKPIEFRISEYDGKTLQKVGANEATIASTYNLPL